MSQDMELLVSLLVQTLTPQRLMIEGATGAMPSHSYDDFALGYIVGLCDAVVKSNRASERQFPEVVVSALYIAFGDGKNIGATEERLLKRVSELATLQPEDYVRGKEVAMKGYMQSLSAPIYLPDMAWFSYVRESQKRIKDFDGAVEALANFKKCDPESARLIIQRNIEKFTKRHLEKGVDHFIAKLAAEDEVFKELARVIYGNENSQ